MQKGYIQIYTGDGKGKTTAALGLALRAAGAGLKVFIAQFIKNQLCSEHIALERFKDLITIKQYGTGFINGKPKSEDYEIILQGFKEVAEILKNGDFDLVILDEINLAVHLGIISEDELIKVLKEKASNVEVVLTGRGASQKLIEIADLVTEMKEIKHYYIKGVLARKGIEY
ncbi:cob(I)yrinic acid a,c-diamide adenosyltransferase [Thermodesulfovibrio hydrogeniphilus]